jgi:hypothetical protein
MCGTKKGYITGTGTKRKTLPGPEPGPKKKLPGPRPEPGLTLESEAI